MTVTGQCPVCGRYSRVFDYPDSPESLEGCGHFEGCLVATTETAEACPGVQPGDVGFGFCGATYFVRPPGQVPLGVTLGPGMVS